jgi:hypothetical protein
MVRTGLVTCSARKFHDKSMLPGFTDTDLY